ncbi:biorientation of chromosomes in cell division protein 1-like 1 isoform X1 [Musca domestica]|uniref:Biorientation of chromosomes in cell division protein 1-like 1 isoform X1 n=2 Tax=Musca domestica TaxID=7370 RepID=A0A9J7I4F5_MUSDO|nr:biorientation of chromosomes in cell division protein 1-like 1 isoform X1 [Musca domestica]
MDASLVEKIVHEVKSQGVFDEFRKDSMADVDTKPAYQNLRQRVEKSVKKFLSEQTWTPEMNKNQLREKLRRHIAESGFLDVGVERIVDQVVNPKIGSVFQPRIEEIAYKYLGLPPPQKIYEPPPPPLMHPLPPLPLTAPPPPLKVETCSLLPNDLEQVSPDSDKGTVKSEAEGDDKTNVDMETEEKIIDDDESPPFEPLVKSESKDIKLEPKAIKTEHDEPEDNIKKFDDNDSTTVKTEMKDLGESQSSTNIDKDNNSQSMDCRNSQDSQLSSVSSDTRLTPEIKDDSAPPRSSQEEAVTANISEEAQMPKFNENSSEPSCTNGRKESDSTLHFDIKKDEIKFEGTERKKLEDSQVSPMDDDIKCELPSGTPLSECKSDMFKFSVNTSSVAEQKEHDLERTPNAQESSFGSSIEDSASIPTNITNQVTVDEKDKDLSRGEKSPQTAVSTISKIPSTPTATPTATPTVTPTPTPISQPLPPTPSPISTHRADREHSSRHSSSSKHKKHSKERRRSHDREKDRGERYRSSKEGKERHRNSNSSSHKGNSKHSSSSSSNRHSSSSSHNKSSNEKELDRSHSSSRHGKYASSSDKRNSLSSSNKDHSSSSSNTSSTMTKRSGRYDDDHYEAKQKPQRRKSTDSNDDDGDKGGSSTGGGGKLNHGQYQKVASASSSKSKTKYASDTGHSTASKEHGNQPDDLSLRELSEKKDETPKLPNNVVILNDLLENPQTQCIQLDSRGHLIEVPAIQSDSRTITTGNEADLLYFEVDLQESFRQRINILNDTMDLCRKAVNYLRFDSPIDEGIELSSEDDYNHNRANTSISSIRTSLKRKSIINFEDYERTPQKRCPIDKSDENALKTSPTPSDLSVSSKENEEIDKNSALSKKLDRHKAAVEKLARQQRYSSDDLYKPRPILGQRSRRRGMDSVM